MRLLKIFKRIRAERATTAHGQGASNTTHQNNLEFRRFNALKLKIIFDEWCYLRL